MKTITHNIPSKKTIALIAHDGTKQKLIDWCMENKKTLERHNLCGTGTTARLISERTGLEVRGFNSGPLGGDQQIGAKIVEGKINMMVFFSDPLAAQPHDPDVKALMRITQVYDIPAAYNITTADFLIRSELLEMELEHDVVDFKAHIQTRIEKAG